MFRRLQKWDFSGWNRRNSQPPMASFSCGAQKERKKKKPKLEISSIPVWSNFSKSGIGQALWCSSSMRQARKKGKTKDKTKGVERVLLENAFESREVLLSARFPLCLSRRRRSCCYVQGRLTVEILPEMFRFCKAAMGVKKKYILKKRKTSLMSESPQMKSRTAPCWGWLDVH